MRLVWVIVVVLVKNAMCFTTSDIIDVLKKVKLEEKCAAQLDLYVKNLVAFNVSELWPLKMFDATSKLSTGLLSFNFGNMGDFDQCLKTQYRNEQLDIKGKYCLVNIYDMKKTPSRNAKMTFFLDALKKEGSYEKIQNVWKVFGVQLPPQQVPHSAVCVPDGCSDKDIRTVLYKLLDSIDVPWKVGLQCQTAEDSNTPLTTGAIVTISFFAVIVIIMIASTAYDVNCQRQETEPKHILLIAFSCYTNGRKLFQMDRNNTVLPSLNGIRFLSMMWVLLGHNLGERRVVPITNMPDVIDLFESKESMFYLNGSLAVDTFFVITGLLIFYSFMKAKYSGKKFNILLFYIHRYLRLTPAFAAMVLFTATLLKYCGSGPYWKLIELQFQNPCQRRWWVALLYIQNYFFAEDRCVGQGWYLNIDMQLYVFAPIFLLVLWKNAKIGISLLSATIMASMAVPFYVAWKHHIAAIQTNLHGNVYDYMYKYYDQTHTRASPWLIGAILGYMLANIKFKNKNTKIQMNKFVVMAGWITTLAVIPTCIFAGHSTLRGKDYDRWGNAMYLTFVRPAWSCVVSWVIFTCSTGHGGPIDWMLSLPIFQILNRFTYSMYIVHLYVMYIKDYRIRTTGYFSISNVTLEYWGVLLYTLVWSIFWTLAFESPIIVIEKVLFARQLEPSEPQRKHENGNSVEKKEQLP